MLLFDRMLNILFSFYKFTGNISTLENWNSIYTCRLIYFDIVSKWVVHWCNLFVSLKNFRMFSISLKLCVVTLKCRFQMQMQINFCQMHTRFSSVLIFSVGFGCFFFSLTLIFVNQFVIWLMPNKLWNITINCFTATKNAVHARRKYCTQNICCSWDTQKRDELTYAIFTHWHHA